MPRARYSSELRSRRARLERARAVGGLRLKCYMWHNRGMRKAGVRDARQNLTELLDDVKKGREVVITDRGRPVARLAPVRQVRFFPDLARVRAAFRGRNPRLSQAVLDDRDDRP